MQKADKIASIIFIIISIIFGYQALKLPGPIGVRGIGPGGFPSIVSAGLFICGLLMFARLGKRNISGGDYLSIWPRGNGMRNFFIVLVTTFLYPILVYVLGYVICTFLFICFLIKTLGGYRWRYVGLISTLSTVFFYYAFKVLFYMPLPKGFFW
jgi:putative tricarboxylic transport membrane protein